MVPDQQSTIPSSVAVQENIELETFNGITVRKVMQNGRGMIPVVDIANAVKLDRSNLSKHMETFNEYYKQYKGEVKVTTPGGLQTVTCLTRDGILGLLFKINASKSKDPKMVERILEFQHWATSILSQQKTGDLTLRQGQPLTKQATLDCINHYLDIADTMIKRADVPKDIARSIVLTQLQDEHKAINVQPFISYIKAQSKTDQSLLLTEGIPEDKADYERHFSLRKIAEDFIHKPENEIRMKLEDLRIIYRENNMWKLTAEGEKYGKVFFVTPGAPYNMTRRPFIKYNDKLVQLLRDYYNVKVPVTKVVEDGSH